MATSLFTSQTPAVPDANDGTDYTLGTEMSRSNSGQIIRGRWYCPTTPPTGTPDFVLYDGAGTELHREPWPGLVGGQWNETPDFAAPIDYTANDTIVASVYTSGQYCATVDPAFWNGSDLVNGDITAPGATNGRLSNVDSYPSNVVDLCFFVDVVFASAVAPAQGTVSATLDLAPAIAGQRASAGQIGAAIALSLAVTGSSPNSGTVAATLGLAPALAGARASTGVLSASLGLAPALAGARTSVGAVNAALVLTPALAGVRGASGTLVASLRLQLAANGTNGEAGRPVTPYPHPVGPVSGFPWPPRPVKSFQEVTG